MRLTPLVVLGVVASSTAVHGQSINVDFGDAAGVPLETYGAAGQAGAWSAVSIPAGPGDQSGAMPLVGVDGAPVAASITIGPLSGMAQVDAVATDGDDERLLDDHIVGLGDVIVHALFEDLAIGLYEIVVYGWPPDAPQEESHVSIDGAVDDYETLGGAWPGELTDGVTHAVFSSARVVDGTLSVEMGGAPWGRSGVFNGLQIRWDDHLPEDVTEDGVVDIDDVLQVILQWSPPGHGCDGIVECTPDPADVNADGRVSIDDMLLVILAWTG